MCLALAACSPADLSSPAEPDGNDVVAPTPDAGDTAGPDTRDASPDTADAGKDTSDGPPPECTSDQGCDDNNDCTEDFCAFGGECKHFAIAGQCSDDNPCTVGDTCIGSKCIGTKLECDDDNPCTDDACDPLTSECRFIPNSDPCSDGDNCTVDDQCAAGSCASGVAKVCDDGNPCTDDACSAASGECLSQAVSAPCNDGDACTLGDTCKAGKCAPGVAANCSDGDPCTLDSCNSKTGFCAHAPTDGPCDDDNACTSGDNCVGGKCLSGPPPNCQDGNPCTDDLCDPVLGGCIHLKNTKPCEDGNQCTTGDTCANSTCVPGQQAQCDDQNPCTADTCDLPTGKCLFTPTMAMCDDGNPCTVGDECSGGACVPGDPIPCDDGDPCTDHACDVVTGACEYNPDPGVPCDDANACTVVDSCTEVGGCAGVAIDCDDGDLCTVGEECAAGECSPGVEVECDDENACTADECNPATGSCNHAPVADQTPCLPASACASGLCQGGLCEVPAGFDCDDGDPCTEDRCLGGTTCSNAPLSCGAGTDCLDGACVASQGGCVYAVDHNSCDDGIACSLDACLPETGCSYTFPSGCCDAKALLTSFDDSESLPAGWTTSGTGTVAKWQVVHGENATTGEGSLYYGNPVSWNYNNDGSANAGQVTSPQVLIPNTPSPVLRFRIWMDIEKVSTFDRLELFVMPGNVKIWNKQYVAGMQKWHNVVLPLDDYVGQTVRFELRFDTVNADKNNTTGVFVDDVRVLGCQ